MKVSGYLMLRLSILLAVQGVTVYTHANNNDTAKNNKDTIHLLGAIKSPDKVADLMDDSIETELLDSNSASFSKNITQTALLHFVESNKLKSDFHNKKVLKRIYGKLAKKFAKMKYYPIAMQYYYEALSNNEWRYYPQDTSKNNDSLSNGFDIAQNKYAVPALVDTSEYLNNTLLSNNYQKTYFNNSELLFASKKGAENNSETINSYSVSEAFEDGKNAVAYAIIIHVKQPNAGRRKAFTGINNVGHTFITLIKYNSDSTCNFHSFGFYPKKDDFLSATPIHPSSSSAFKDDSVHDWDEAVGKFISERRFKKLKKLIAKYEVKKYNLNSNNCTDFGLYAAGVAGISIANTVGNWPLGRGNNPANAGQSILEGKFINTDTGNTQGLFICADIK